MALALAILAVFPQPIEGGVTFIMAPHSRGIIWLALGTNMSLRLVPGLLFPSPGIRLARSTVATGL